MIVTFAYEKGAQTGIDTTFIDAITSSSVLDGATIRGKSNVGKYRDRTDEDSVSITTPPFETGTSVKVSTEGFQIALETKDLIWTSGDGTWYNLTTVTNAEFLGDRTWALLSSSASGKISDAKTAKAKVTATNLTTKFGSSNYATALAGGAAGMTYSVTDIGAQCRVATRQADGYITVVLRAQGVGDGVRCAAADDLRPVITEAKVRRGYSGVFFGERYVSLNSPLLPRLIFPCSRCQPL